MPSWIYRVTGKECLWLGRGKEEGKRVGEEKRHQKGGEGGKGDSLSQHVLA